MTGDTPSLVSRLRGALAAMLLLQAGLSAAAPTGGELLAACRQSLQNGFTSLEGSMCAWYVTPCDCGLDTPSPAVCLPPDPPVERLAREVVQGLGARPELQERSAPEAAAAVLAALYPCPEENRDATQE